MRTLPTYGARGLAGWGWFGVWATVGTTAALSLVVVGPLALIPAVGAALLMVSRPRSRGSAPGLVSGAGLLLLYVAWVQRQGPGTTCWHTAMSSGCDQHLSPMPWLVGGLALVLLGVAAHRRRTRHLARG